MSARAARSAMAAPLSRSPVTIIMGVVLRKPRVHQEREREARTSSVMDILPPEFPDVGVFRRMIFAATQLPEDVPQYWELVARFASQGMQKSAACLQSESVKLVIENLKALYPQAFVAA